MTNANVTDVMNKVEIFQNADFGSVRTMVIDNEIWFVGKDVAENLGYSNPSKAVSTHVDDEDKTFIMLNIADTQNGNVPIGQTKTAIINESGLYGLVLSSKLPKAKEFKHWITSDVIPSIRRHGTYMTSETIEKVLTSPDFIIKLATQLKDEKEKRVAAEAERDEALETIEEQKPLVHFANQVSISENTIDMGKMAKLLQDDNIRIGRNKLFEWLRNKKILMKNNVPYQRYVDQGYFEVKESYFKTPSGLQTQQTTFVTGKGQIFVFELLRKEYESYGIKITRRHVG